MLMTMVDGNTARDAQLAQHGKRMARVELICKKVDQQLPSLEWCVAACSEFGPTAAAVASTLNKIRDHMVTVSQRLDDMEETIRDTILDLKVDVISTMLALLEHNNATRFTAVNTALAQMASSPHAGIGPDGPTQRETPPTHAAVPDPLDLDTAIPGLARSAGNDGASHLSCFQAATTFRPGSAFPAGNRFPHTPDGGHAHADSNHRRRLADNRDNAGVRLAWRSGSAIPADEDGAAPYPVGHSQRSAYTCSLGLRDTPTEVRRGH